MRVMAPASLIPQPGSSTPMTTSSTPSANPLTSPLANRRTNWAGNVTFRAHRRGSPRSIAELQEIVAGSEQLRVLGTGHSFNQLADTPGDLVSVAALPPRFDLDPTGSTVTVSAGTTYGGLAQRLHAAGFALESLGSLPHISVGGAIATGTHGSGNTVTGLAAAVTALQRVNSNGELIESRAEADKDFPGSVVALGALGVVTAVTLRVVPAFEVRQWVYDDLPAAAVWQHAEEIFARAFSVSLFTEWRGDSFRQVWLKQRVLADTDPDQPSRRWLGATLAQGQRHPIAGMPVENCTEQLGSPGPWHARLPHFRSQFTPSSGNELQSEYLLPREHTANALAALNGIRDRIASLVQICEIRTVARDHLWLSPAYGRDTVGVHFTWVPDVVAVTQALPVIEDTLAPYDPRPHWAKLFTLSTETLASRYERYDDFLALMFRADPVGKFRNELLNSWFPAGADSAPGVRGGSGSAQAAPPSRRGRERTSR
jgi:alditol oxidase